MAKRCISICLGWRLSGESSPRNSDSPSLPSRLRPGGPDGHSPRGHTSPRKQKEADIPSYHRMLAELPRPRNHPETLSRPQVLERPVRQVVGQRQFVREGALTLWAVCCRRSGSCPWTLPTRGWWVPWRRWRSATACKSAMASPPPTPPSFPSRRMVNSKTAAANWADAAGHLPRRRAGGSGLEKLHRRPLFPARFTCCC